LARSALGKLDSFVRGLGELIAMRAIRAAMTTVSTTWAAADHSRIARTLKIAASIVVTTAVVAIASFVAVALSLT
jgi:hypothetical protein